MSALLTQSSQIEALAARLAEAPALALDTEFIRERTYFPKLALVQIGDGRDAELVDPLALPDPGALRPLLEGDKLKLMHSPGEDLQAFLHGWKLPLGPIFDTQLAAALTGHGAGKSYQSLVAEITGVHLEKGETRSDWLRRPLSESQCRYAYEDVKHLHALHEKLDAELARLGRQQWLAEDCERLVANATADEPEPYPHLASRAAQRMDREGQARLRRLLQWREARARASDRPRGWILDNELLVPLAQKLPTRDRFDALLDSHPRAPRRGRGRDELWDLLEAPLDGTEASMPLAREPDAEWKGPLKAMQAVVAERAAELDIPEGVLCPRRHLESLLATRTLPKELEGWRSTILRDELLARLP